MNQSSYDPTLPEGLLPDLASPEWLSKATAMVGVQSVPGLIILFGSIVKKKWAVNSAFMALYAFAMVLVCCVFWAHHMSFGDKTLSRIGEAQKFLSAIPMANSLLGRMNFYAWMWFMPLWLTFSYTVGAFSVLGDGFIDKNIIHCCVLGGVIKAEPIRKLN